jgi:WD40 repeat protein
MRKQREGENILNLTGHTDGVNCLAVASDESVLVSGSEDSTARIWAVTDDFPEGEDRCLGVLK